MLNEVYEQSPQQFNKFLKAWNKFNSESNSLSLDNKKMCIRDRHCTTCSMVLPAKMALIKYTELCWKTYSNIVE